jgi:hypothetical protein
MTETARRYPGVTFKIVQAAVCGTDGGEIIFHQRHNLSSSVLGHEIGGEVGAVSVPKRSLSSLIEQFAAPGKSVSLICDTEGGEIDILANDRAAFGRINQVAIELHKKHITNSDITPGMMAAQITDIGFVLLTDARDETCCLFGRPKGSYHDNPLNAGESTPMFV